MARSDHPRPSPTGARARASRRGGAGGTLLGVFIGLVLGLGLAAGVAYYLMKVAKSDADKPRFDFYKILPGVDEPKVQAEAKKSPDRALAGEAKDRGAEKAPDTGARSPRPRPSRRRRPPMRARRRSPRSDSGCRRDRSRPKPTRRT